MTPPPPGPAPGASAAALAEELSEPLIRRAPPSGAPTSRAPAGLVERADLDGALAAGAAVLDAPSAASAAEEATPIAGEARLEVSRPAERFWTVASAHAAVDMYSAIIPALSLALAGALDLDKVQIRTLFVLNSVVSGISQPIFARLTDTWNTRVCAPLGLAMAALALCAVGYATAWWQLVVLQVIGMIGSGMFHPIGAALSGHLGRGISLGRSRAVTIFFTAGMVGSVIGPVLVTRMNEAAGLRSLAWLIPPALLFAWALHLVARRVPHRHSLKTARVAEAPTERAARRGALQLLFWAAVMRFGVNTGLFFLFAMWAKERIADDANRAASLSGALFAFGSIGMGVAATIAGYRVRPGHEKTPMVVMPLLTVPLIALMGFTPPGAPWGYALMCVLVFLSAAGYASAAPLAISAAQRLMPGNTGMASSLMMGGAWTLSAFFPFFAGWAMDAGGLPLAFGLMAAFMASNAALAALLPRGLLRDTAHH